MPGCSSGCRRSGNVNEGRFSKQWSWNGRSGRVPPVRKRIAVWYSLSVLGFLTISCKRSSDWQFSGTIETDEVRVASRYGGRVEAIGAWDGDSVTNGQIIVALDAAELRAQRDKAAAVLAELKAGPRPEEIAAAKREWEAILAELDFARIEAKRAKE